MLDKPSDLPRHGDRSRVEGRLGYWAVAFLDLLGYHAALSDYDVYPLPRHPDEQALLNSKVVRPYFFKKRLLDGVRLFIDADVQPPPSIARLPEDERATAATWTQTRIRVDSLGDAVTMEMALERTDGHFPALAVGTVLAGASSAVLLQLAAGADDPENTLPLRGGIDIGSGVVFEDKLYSAALGKAVRLEELAGFPRVLVGDRFREYVSSLIHHEGADTTSQFIRVATEGLDKAFYQDPADQQWCLDFIGTWFRARVARRGQLVPKLVADASVFVEKAMLRYKDDQRLLPKYEWLNRYFRSRRHLWT